MHSPHTNPMSTNRAQKLIIEITPNGNYLIRFRAFQWILKCRQKYRCRTTWDPSHNKPPAKFHKKGENLPRPFYMYEYNPITSTRNDFIDKYINVLCCGRLKIYGPQSIKSFYRKKRNHNQWKKIKRFS